MTVSARGNPYGVTMPYEPVDLSSAPSQSVDHPLVPWQREEHDGQWVDVDNARRQLDRFVSSWPDWGELRDRQVGHGRLVIVTGPEGMGKTTLIHRCVHHLEGLLGVRVGAHADPSGSPSRVILVMTAGYDNDGSGISVDSSGAFASTETINARIRDEITNALARYYEPSAVEAVLAENDPYRAYGRVGELLDQQDALLVGVIPHIKWSDSDLRTGFLQTCLSHARSRMVLFAEVSHGDDEMASLVVGGLPERKGVTHLALGKLNEDDVWKFSLGGGGQASCAEAARRDLRAAHADWIPRDVRELRRVFHAAADGLSGFEGPWQLTADMLRPHWQRLRPDRHSLRRDPPTGQAGD